MTGSRRAALPAYFDSLIAAYHSGHAGRHVHLGYWDDPPPLSAPVLPNEFAMAQSRLTQRMIAHVGARTGQCILDVGCGLGGTLAALNERNCSPRGSGGPPLPGCSGERRYVSSA